MGRCEAVCSGMRGRSPTGSEGLSAYGAGSKYCDLGQKRHVWLTAVHCDQTSDNSGLERKLIKLLLVNMYEAIILCERNELMK